VDGRVKPGHDEVGVVRCGRTIQEARRSDACPDGRDGLRPSGESSWSPRIPGPRRFGREGLGL